MPWHCRCRKLRLFCFACNGMNKILTVVTAFSLALITCAAAAKNAAPVHVPLPRNNPLKQTQQEKKQNSPLASALFSEKKLPSVGRPMAIGYYPSGCLQGGVELPTTGPTSILAEHPSPITDDLIALASGITGVAQRQSSSFQVAAVRFDKEASNRQVATRLAWAQTGPVTIFYGRGGRRIQSPRGLITVIVRQGGADNGQCFRAAPQPRQHLRDLVRNGVTDDKRQQ